MFSVPQSTRTMSTVQNNIRIVFKVIKLTLVFTGLERKTLLWKIDSNKISAKVFWGGYNKKIFAPKVRAVTLRVTELPGRGFRLVSRDLAFLSGNRNLAFLSGHLNLAFLSGTLNLACLSGTLNLTFLRGILNLAFLSGILNLAFLSGNVNLAFS